MFPMAFIILFLSSVAVPIAFNAPSWLFHSPLFSGFSGGAVIAFMVSIAIPLLFYLHRNRMPLDKAAILSLIFGPLWAIVLVILVIILWIILNPAYLEFALTQILHPYLIIDLLVIGILSVIVAIIESFLLTYVKPTKKTKQNLIETLKPTIAKVVITLLLAYMIAPVIFYDTGIRCMAPCPSTGSASLFQYHLGVVGDHYIYEENYTLFGLLLIPLYLIVCFFIYLFSKK